MRTHRRSGPKTYRSLLGFANSCRVLTRRFGHGVGAPAWVRLHALTGALPLAGYLVLHLVGQASVFFGARAHQRWSSAGEGVLLLALEILALYVPLCVHVVLGFGRMALHREADGAGWAGAKGRLLQQLSGALLLVFLVVHFWQFRLRSWSGEMDRADYFPELCASLSSTAWGGVPWVAIGYLLGLAAAAFHGAHGLYHALSSFGLVGPGQRWAGRCCGALGLCLFGLGALIVIDLATGSVLIHFPGG